MKKIDKNQTRTIAFHKKLHVSFFFIIFHLMKKNFVYTPVILALFASASVNASTFFYNQVGYDAAHPKTVIIKALPGLDGAPFSISNGGVPVFTGTLSAGTNPDNWISDGQVFYTADFSSVNTTGFYSLELGSEKLENIVIADNALALTTLKSVMDYFYKDRADKEPVLGWDTKVSVFGSTGITRDVHGGWYDASGDVSKYLSHLSYANNLNPQQIPLTVWSLAFAASKMPTTLAANPSTVTAIDEAIYGADFLVRMQDESGFFYMTVFDNWGSGSRYLCAFSGSNGVKSADYKTAFREGGGMAIAALARAATLGKAGDYPSEVYLAAAVKGFDHLQAKQTIGGACEYCDDKKENIIDDYTALLAATELYAATGVDFYLTAARQRAVNLRTRLHESGLLWSDNDMTRPFWHASDAGLPLVALCRYAEIEKDKSFLKGTLSAIQKHLTWLISVTNEVDNPFGYARQTYKTAGTIKNGFFIPHDNESNYWWQGEDARIASLSAAAVYASKILGTQSASINKFAADQLDWILGKNPYGVCMMYGKGLKNPQIYDGTSKYDATLEGGIANGISGKNVDGSGIVWDNIVEAGFPATEPWNNWRWVEQWLPHSTWYLMALAARYDEATKPLAGSSTGFTKASIAANRILLQDRNLTVNLENSSTKTVSLFDLRGHQVLNQPTTGKSITINLQALQSGVYMVKVDGATQKIVLK